MNKIKRFNFTICLILISIGIFVLAGWDRHQATAFTSDTWLSATSLPEPLAANLVKCVDDPDSFYMVGGITTTGNTNQLIRYDILPGQWQNLAPMPAPRRAMATACFQGNIYVSGGMNNWLIYNSFYIYNIASNSWITGPNLPNPVWGALMTAWDGKLFIIGGTRINDPWTPIKRVDVFDLSTWEWTAGGGQGMPFAASFYSGVQVGPYAYVVGGISGTSLQNIDKTQRYNMATNEWEQGPVFTSARALGSLAATDSHLYMLGGDLDGGGDFDFTDLVDVLDLSAWPAGEWINLGDPLPIPNLAAGTTCSEILAGGEIWAVGGCDQTLTPYNTNYYRPTEPCVSYGVKLPEPWEAWAEPGQTVSYTVSITNTGVVTDYFTMEVTTTWTVNLLPNSYGPIGPGESLPVAISVDVPAGGMRGEFGTTQISATSLSNPTASDSTNITTWVKGYALEVVSISPPNQSGHPGEVLTYTLQVSNIGDFQDSYTVTISATWGTSSPISVGPLLPGEDTGMVVNVEIPLGTGHGEWDAAVITLISQGDPRISQAVILTSTSVLHQTLLPLALKN